MQKNKTHIRKLRNLLILVIDPILLAITFALPFLYEHIANAYTNISSNTLWTLQIISTIIIFSISTAKVVYVAHQDRKHRKNEQSRKILSHINDIFEHKAELIRNSTYHPSTNTNNAPLFYDVHSYIRQICKNMRNTIAEIIETESEYVDVAMIYKYHDSSDWKWLSGKSGTSSAKCLNEFVKDPTLFNYVITENLIVFENNKSQCKFYRSGRRDSFFHNKGSVMAMPLTYFNNTGALIDIVLVISTYGVRFVESNKREIVNEFQTALIYEILPYYISLLQTAFGEMYLRHILKPSVAEKTEKD